MPRLLDLFCGAGGASDGYHRAGWEVVGVDINPQPHYPYAFHQADAIAVLDDLLAGRGWSGFDAIHSSPPCQAHSVMTKRWGPDRASTHPDLVAPTRDRLRLTGLPWVIENVVGAPLLSPVMLCGSMFGLWSGEYQLRRHRLFESTVYLWPPGPCAHQGKALPVYGNAGGSSRRDGLKFPGTDAWREGMDIAWMTGKELAESIPPAYTQHIGQQLLASIGGV